jgi:hypothetical protein
VEDRNDEIKKCPCGCSGETAIEIGEFDDRRVVSDCGTTGPWKLTREMAIVAWNKIAGA